MKFYFLSSIRLSIKYRIPTYYANLLLLKVLMTWYNQCCKIIQDTTNRASTKSRTLKLVSLKILRKIKHDVTLPLGVRNSVVNIIFNSIDIKLFSCSVRLTPESGYGTSKFITLSMVLRMHKLAVIHAMWFQWHVNLFIRDSFICYAINFLKCNCQWTMYCLASMQSKM